MAGDKGKDTEEEIDQSGVDDSFYQLLDSIRAATSATSNQAIPGVTVHVTQNNRDTVNLDYLLDSLRDDHEPPPDLDIDQISTIIVEDTLITGHMDHQQESFIQLADKLPLEQDITDEMLRNIFIEQVPNTFIALHNSLLNYFNYKHRSAGLYILENLTHSKRRRALRSRVESEPFVAEEFPDLGFNIVPIKGFNRSEVTPIAGTTAGKLVEDALKYETGNLLGHLVLKTTGALGKGIPIDMLISKLVAELITLEESKDVNDPIPLPKRWEIIEAYIAKSYRSKIVLSAVVNHISNKLLSLLPDVHNLQQRINRLDNIDDLGLQRFLEMSNISSILILHPHLYLQAYKPTHADTIYTEELKAEIFAIKMILEGIKQGAIYYSQSLEGEGDYQRALPFAKIVDRIEAVLNPQIPNAGAPDS